MWSRWSLMILSEMKTDLEEVLYLYRFKNFLIEHGFPFEDASVLKIYDFFASSYLSDFKIVNKNHKKLRTEYLEVIGVSHEDRLLFKKIGARRFIRDIYHMQRAFESRGFLNHYYLEDGVFKSHKRLHPCNFMHAVLPEATAETHKLMTGFYKARWSESDLLRTVGLAAPFVSHYKVENGYLILPCGKKLRSLMFDGLEGVLKCAVLKVCPPSGRVIEQCHSHLFKYERAYNVYVGPFIEGIVPQKHEASICVSLDKLESMKRRYLEQGSFRHGCSFEHVMVFPKGKDFVCIAESFVQGRMLHYHFSPSRAAFKAVFDSLVDGSFFLKERDFETEKIFYGILEKGRLDEFRIQTMDALKENIVFSAFDVDVAGE
jgi:hypothetical protein